MECQIKDLRVSYETFGDGIPIIILHGWGIDHQHVMSSMEPLFKHRSGWKRFYPDLPGHGKTPGAAWVTSQDSMLDVILAFIDSVIPGQRFAVAGASAGAYLARGVVYRRLASIVGVLLNVPMIKADNAKRQVPSPITLVTDGQLASEITADEAQGCFEGAVVQNRRVMDFIRVNYTPNSQTGDEPFKKTIRDFPEKYAFSFDVDALPTPCSAPSLIVTGRQDAIVGYRDAWEILDNYPRGTFCALDRSGHFLEIEQESLFRALAGEWLDRAEEYARSEK